MNQTTFPSHLGVAMGIAIVFGCAYFFIRGQLQADAIEITRMDAEINSLRTHLISLQTELQALQLTPPPPQVETQNGVKVSQSNPTTIAALAEHTEPATAVATLRYDAQRQSPSEARHQAAERYNIETRQASWAEFQETVINTLLTSNAAFKDFKLDSLECKSISCRLDIDVSGTLEPHTTMALVGAIGRTMPHASWNQQGDKLTLIVSEIESD